MSVVIGILLTLCQLVLQILTFYYYNLSKHEYITVFNWYLLLSTTSWYHPLWVQLYSMECCLLMNFIVYQTQLHGMLCVCERNSKFHLFVTLLSLLLCHWLNCHTLNVMTPHYMCFYLSNTEQPHTFYRATNYLLWSSCRQLHTLRSHMPPQRHIANCLGGARMADDPLMMINCPEITVP